MMVSVEWRLCRRCGKDMERMEVHFLRKRIKYIARIMAVIWMIVIFSFSAKPADLSSQDSLWVGKKIGCLLIDDFEKRPEEEQRAFAKKISYPVRKGAHMTEYAILGILLFGSWNLSEGRLKKAAGFSWGAGTAYAVTDEFHQLFVEGRSGQFTDVMIDSAGALIGVVLCAVTTHLMMCQER